MIAPFAWWIAQPLLASTKLMCSVPLTGTVCEVQCTPPSVVRRIA
jgi:hypothetical protein